MDSYETDEIPMLDGNQDSTSSKFSSRTRSASMSSPKESVPSSLENYIQGHTGPLRRERKTPFTQMSGPLYIKSKPGETHDPVSDSLHHKENMQLTNKYLMYNDTRKNGWMHTGYAEKNEHLQKSGQLGMCNDPYCTTCPSYYNYKVAQKKHRTSDIFDSEFHNALYGDAKGWVRRLWSFLRSYIPGVMNPHTKVVQHWNKCFAISCLFAIFIDPLFLFVLSVLEDRKCIVIDDTTSTIMVVFRSITDSIYLFHILLQFRIAYIAPESRVVGAGELVDHPTKIAIHYLTGFFAIDLFSVLPVPQVIIAYILPNSLSSSGANYAKNLLRVAILVQYIPRLYRFLPLLVGQSSNGFIFESAWANFVINILIFILSGHVVGSWWYLFGLQRVNQCLRDACHSSKIPLFQNYTDCAYGEANNGNHSSWLNEWTSNLNATACFEADKSGGFDYGVYKRAVNLVTQQAFMTRYVYSLFWGFQQISTLAGNLEPSYFVWEVLFTMAVIGLGLLLFALLIGNMQNFLQSLGRRRLEMSFKRRDVEEWMKHRRLPEALRRKVREAERYNWVATRGVNEENLMESLPEDLQRDIRRHLFEFVKKIHIFCLMDEPILDAICERLRQKTYIQSSKILYPGGFIDKMVFIVRGKMESIGEDGIIVPLSEGAACGEELLTWCLEHSFEYQDGKKSKFHKPRILSNRLVSCLTNVEAFILTASDIEEVTMLFPRFLRNPRVQGAVRYESPYWRSFAATRIQVAWRYRKKRLNRLQTSRITRQ